MPLRTMSTCRNAAIAIVNVVAEYPAAESARIAMSGEQLWELVQIDGRIILAAQQAGTFPTAF